MARLPDLADLLQDLDKTSAAIAIIRGKVSATEERLKVRREENVERPPARTGRGLDKGHVDFVHVGTFLAVHFDADEMFVEILGGFFALEGLAFHHVAPVTR